MADIKTLLATDMDGTVIPLEVNSRRKAEIAAFKNNLDESSELILAYVTGRDFPLAVKGIHQHQLPEPDILVGDVGTSVYHRTAFGYEQDEEYVRLMEEARGGLDVREASQKMAHISELLLQPDERQTESKLSYHLTPESNPREVLASVNEALVQLGGKLQAVYSIGAPHGTGLLDLLPAGIGKDFAIRYLRGLTDVGPEDVIYAGDSGNDLAAMLTGFKSILVGNATPDLREELTSRGGEMGILDQLYFAEGFYVAGVMEGCRHFGLF